jgi:glucan phosphoethanolaminetransferase (alkaline phosphatase superfamily)
MNKWGHDMGDKTIQGNKTPEGKIIPAVIVCACFTALWVTAYLIMSNINLGNVIDEKFLNTLKYIHIFKPVVLFLGVFISALILLYIIFLIARKKNPNIKSSVGFAFLVFFTALPLVGFSIIALPRIISDFKQEPDSALKWVTSIHYLSDGYECIVNFEYGRSYTTSSDDELLDQIDVPDNVYVISLGKEIIDVLPADQYTRPK